MTLLEQGGSHSVFLSALPASCWNTELQWVAGGRQISAAVRTSNDSLPRCPYLMMYASKSRNGIHQLQLHGYNIYIYMQLQV